jgi:uncharacterized protein (TIGR03382 family)
MRRWIAGTFAIVFVFLLASPARAFCGFYVGGEGAKLFNKATQVVLMREGTRTVLSMQNAYDGPPQGFAMVVPVPVVLQKDVVKTLPRTVFARIDQLDAPRLVEYWEEDPCYMPPPAPPMAAAAPNKGAATPSEAPEKKDLGVKIEAQYTVGEYEIVILSAKDSGGLETWLKQNKYAIPDGSEPYLRPYVEAGSKFFVARVDVKKVTFDGGTALLSPLRFHYDAETFSLPVRLGLVSSNGTQDLVVHILSSKRHEVANYPNVAIPTNLDVAEKARDQFGAFYTGLFDRTIAENPKAVVTEYAWDSNSCDPCPTPPLSASDLATLGAEVLPSVLRAKQAEDAAAGNKPNANCMPPYTIDENGRKKYKLECLAANQQPRFAPPTNPLGSMRFVLTRLHARYGKDTLGEDLVFREAGPITGGREVRSARSGGGESALETGASSGYANNFQARYAVRHPWTGPIACANPIRGRWGGPPANQPSKGTIAAKNVGLLPRGGDALGDFVKGDVSQIAFKIALPPAPLATAVPTVPPTPTPTTDPTAPPSAEVPEAASGKRGCLGCSAAGGASPAGIGALLALVCAWIVRRRKAAP